MECPNLNNWTRLFSECILTNIGKNMCYFKNNLSFSGFHTERKRGHSWIWKTLGRSRQLCIVTDPQGHLIPKHNGLQSSEQIFRNIESLGKGSIFRKPPQLILGHCSSNPTTYFHGDWFSSEYYCEIVVERPDRPESWFQFLVTHRQGDLVRTPHPSWAPL